MDEVMVELEVQSYTVEYAGCGSHRMVITAKMGFGEADNLLEWLEGQLRSTEGGEPPVESPSSAGAAAGSTPISPERDPSRGDPPLRQLDRSGELATMTELLRWREWQARQAVARLEELARKARMPVNADGHAADEGDLAWAEAAERALGIARDALDLPGGEG